MEMSAAQAKDTETTPPYLNWASASQFAASAAAFVMAKRQDGALSGSAGC